MTGSSIRPPAPPPENTGRRHLVSGAARLGLGTFLSRLLGLGRDMTRAWLFGTGMAADAFTVAFRIPNLLRALFAEGALSASLVPVLSDFVEKDDLEATNRFLRAMATVLFLALGVVTILGVLIAPLIVPYLVHGFHAVPGKVELTVRLTRLLFPYILLIGSATLAMAVLNTHRHFTAPALAPAVFNIVVIAGAVLVAPRLGTEPSTQIYGLAGAVLVGGLMQAMIQFPPLRGLRISLWPSGELRHPGVTRVLLLMLPGVLGIAVQELNAFVDTFLASLLKQGSVSALEYGQRLMQLPLGVFGVALGTAVLPTLSRQVSRGERHEAEDTTAFAIRLALLVLLPASIWLVVLAKPILALLFQRGAFGRGDSLAMTASALRFYSCGLVAYGAAKSLVPLFYAHKDTRTPVKAAIASLSCNVVLNLVLMQFLALGGLALATALSSVLNVALLYRWSRSKLKLDPFRGLRRCLVRVGPAAVGSGLAAWVASWYLAAHAGGGLAGRAAAAMVPLVLAAALYLLALRALRTEELEFLSGLFRDRLRRRSG